MPPARKVAILACMDARLHVYGLLGLSEGEAHVIRNAGGVATDDAVKARSKPTWGPAACARCSASGAGVASVEGECIPKPM